eukprot:scaffold294925_cov32-Tisochrysis_lutea.AAC.1
MGTPSVLGRARPSSEHSGAVERSRLTGVTDGPPPAPSSPIISLLSKCGKASLHVSRGDGPPLFFLFRVSFFSPSSRARPVYVSVLRITVSVRGHSGVRD